MNDVTTFDEDTLEKVYAGLNAAGVFGQQSVDAVNQIQNRGILFRERLLFEAGDGGSASDDEAPF